MIPANSIAETIVRLRSDKDFYLLQATKNTELIEQLEPLAEWAEITEESKPEGTE
jgi:hypothetical protein